VSWHRIAGEFFILRLPETGKAQELYCLNPAAIQVEPNPNGSAIPLAYTYGFGEKKKRYPVNVVTGESQILHVKTFNPTDPFRGLSPLSPAARAVDTQNNGSKWNSSLLRNGARPSGIVEFEKSAPNETTLSQLREYFKKAWQGVVNAGNIPILTGGAKFTPLSFNPKDMDFKDSMSEFAKNVALVYGVPLPLITLEAATHSNMEQAEEALWIDTVLPLLNVIISSLARFLMPSYGLKGQKLAYNADSVPALEARRERLYKRMQGAVAGTLLTPDEARVEMGFEEVGANQLIVSSLSTTIDKLGQQPQQDLGKALKSCGYSDEQIKQMLPEFVT
jgi:HK97 family phage portal protein